jgi:hypothetical protein
MTMRIKVLLQKEFTDPYQTPPPVMSSNSNNQRFMLVKKGGAGCGLLGGQPNRN